MITIETVEKLALSFEECEVKPHFEKSSFRIRNKIFASLDTAKHQLVVKLNAIDQSVFCDYDPKVIYPVKGGWGKQGYTVIELSKVKKSMLKDMLTLSYCNMAPKKLAEKYRTE